MLDKNLHRGVFNFENKSFWKNIEIAIETFRLYFKQFFQKSLNKNEKEKKTLFLVNPNRHMVKQISKWEKKWIKIPSTENGDWFLPKEKSLAILHLDIMVLPLTVYTIILEHVGLS